MARPTPSSHWPVFLVAFVALAAVVAVSVLLVLGFVHRPHDYGLGEEAAFSGLDPHLHVAVLSARCAETDERLELVLGLRNSADHTTVDPTALRLRLHLPDGECMAPLQDWPARAGHPGAAPLPPGEQREIVFRFGATDPEGEIWITRPSWLDRILPGGERHALVPKLVFPLARATSS